MEIDDGYDDRGHDAGRDVPEPPAQALDEFKAAIKAYIALHDWLQQSAKEQREARRKKNELSQVIIEFMKVNRYTECALDDGKLVRKESKRLEPLKKDHILEELVKTMGEAQAENTLVSIFGKRKVTETDILTRTRSKAARKQDA